MDDVESLMEDEEEVDNESEGVSSPNINTHSASLIQSTTSLPSLTDPSLYNIVREIGQEAVWSLSTAKPGNGVEQIRDSSMDTYWQSDGGQPEPHLINIQFSKRASVCEVAFYLDYNLDESYTPRKISIRAGMTFHDLEEVRVVDLHEPNGWVSVPLIRSLDHLELEEEDLYNKENSDEELRVAIRRPIRAHFVQICIIAMHQNGRDTHIRQVKVFGPRSEAVSGRRGSNILGFTTVEMTQFDCIR